MTRGQAAPGRPGPAQRSSGGLLLTDEQWARIRPLLPRATVGRPAAPHRRIVEAIIYRDRAGIAWRDLPPRFGAWQTVWKRHRRWSADGTWDRVWAALDRLEKAGQPGDAWAEAGV